MRFGGGGGLGEVVGREIRDAVVLHEGDVVEEVEADEVESRVFIIEIEGISHGRN